MTWWQSAVAAAIAVGMTVAAGRESPAQTIDEAPVVAGAQLFRTHCASCHGVTARGDGPIALLHLNRRLFDLTLLSALNDDEFPTARIHRIIDGRDQVAHGVPEMPVWGDVFTRAEGRSDEGSVEARIAALVAYLESIQRSRQ